MKIILVSLSFAVLLSGCATTPKDRRAFNACVDWANADFQAGRTTYAARTDKVKACLAEYNR